MLNLRRCGILVASAAAFAFAPAIGSSSANAAAVNVASPLKSITDANVGVQEVQSRRKYRSSRYRNGSGFRGRSYSGRSYRGRGYRGRDYGYYRGYRRGYRNNILPYIGLGIAGAVLSHGLSSSSSYASSAMDRCASRFQSFEWDTGYYTTYGGDKRLCPYLR